MFESGGYHSALIDPALIRVDPLLLWRVSDMYGKPGQRAADRNQVINQQECPYDAL